MSSPYEILYLSQKCLFIVNSFESRSKKHFTLFQNFKKMVVILLNYPVIHCGSSSALKKITLIKSNLSFLFFNYNAFSSILKNYCLFYYKAFSYIFLQLYNFRFYMYIYDLP